MNKETIMEILQCCLWSFEGMNNKQILDYGFKKRNVNIGIKLNKFLEDSLNEN